jgi:lysophospholipase L1-like esterase
MRITPFLLALTCSLMAIARDSDVPQSGSGYLALGDSLAFGYTPLVPLGDLTDYHGYPQLVAQQLTLNLANSSCFGETSGHFLNLAAPDLGCAQWRASLPLFVSYSGTQMNYAENYLSTNKHTGLITIDIGINDLGVLLQSCNNNIDCAIAGEPAVLAAYAQHLIDIFLNLRRTGYSGPIVAVTAYAFNYSDPTELLGIVPLNAILSSITSAFGGKVADVFTAFQAAAAPDGGNTCATGLLVQLTSTTCDTHPSPAGHALIAQTILKQVQ